jgi:RNA polymerase sigma-70 factor (sigma-E family)
VTGTRDEEFRGYVLQRRPELLRTATLLAAGDAHLAEDLVQTTLTRLYLNWPAFRQATSPDAYARRVLVNALIDEGRRSWRRRERSHRELPEPARQAVPGPGDSTPGDEVHRALSELPARMRAALVLRYFHDLSVTETAELLDCAPGTVKSQTGRALEKMRARLGTPLTVPDGPHPAGPTATGRRGTATGSAVSVPTRRI